MQNYLQLNIKYLRKENGLTIIDFSKIIGKSKSMISDYENGKSEPDFNTIEAIAKHFKVSQQDLMFKNLQENTDADFKTNVEFIEDSKIKKIKVPVLPISAFATFLETTEKGLSYKELDIDFDTVEKIAGIKYDKFTAIARITGNSMYPHYKSGCKVLCTLVSDGNWEYTRGACVVSLRSGMVVFKRVKAGANKNILLLTSDNEEGGEMEIQIADILCMWKAEYKTYEPAE